MAAEQGRGESTSKAGRRIVVIVGSAREASNSLRAARAAAALASSQPDLRQGVNLDWIEPRSLDLRIPGTQASVGVFEPLSRDLKERVTAAAGLLVVTPEYDGSYSAVLKLVLEHLGYPSAMAGKPVAILGVASGAIGAARAIDHLRAVAFHSGAVVLPGSVSIANVSQAFDPSGAFKDPATQQRTLSLVRGLLVAAGALAKG